jgi:type IV pilus assembly protein PilV
MPARRHRPARPSRPPARPARGFALIEVLIALLIFSLAVLGLVGLQASMTRAASGAKYRADAAYLATELIGQMWTDQRNLARYNDCSAYAPCEAWLVRVRERLPVPAGATPATVRADTATGAVTLRVTWQAPSEPSHFFETVTSIHGNATP